jgi:hypothetical protein
MRLLPTLRRFAFVRLLAVLGAVLQVGAAPAAAMAEGQFAQKTGLAQAHVESERSSTCVAVHADDCALCQLLSVVSVTPAPSATLVAVATALGTASTPIVLDAGVAGRGEPPSRAPPASV